MSSRAICPEDFGVDLAGLATVAFASWRLTSSGNIFNNGNFLSVSDYPESGQKKILGHENRSTTEIYLHSIGKSEREAMKVYEELTEKSHIETKKEGTEKYL